MKRNSHSRVGRGTRALCALALAATVLFCAGSSGAYRTGADLPELETTAAVRWQSPRIDFVVGGTSPSGLNLTGVGQTLHGAMTVWNVAACGKVALSFAGGSLADAVHGDGVNTVSFVHSNWQSLAPKESAATTDVIYERPEGGDWSIVEADIYLNAQDYSWVAGLSGGEAKDLYVVLLHELGHALGLLHPCEIGIEGVEECSQTPALEKAVMFPGYTPENRELSSDDRSGLCFLYGCTETCSNECDGAPCPCVGADCPPPACDTPEACRSAECAGDSRCFGTNPIGDPCERDADCDSGYCTSDGYCADRCETQSCETEACAAACKDPPLAPLGGECGDASHCLGGECLVGASSLNLCTRACSLRLNDCPSDWSCQTVEARPVCAPPYYAPESESCAIHSPRGASVSFSSACFAALVLLGSVFLRRSRRSNQRKNP